jgi:hypothetical protein
VIVESTVGENSKQKFMNNNFVAIFVGLITLEISKRQVCDMDGRDRIE